MPANGSPLPTTYVGPPVDDAEVLDALPSDLRTHVEPTNGYIAYDGGFHLRGACLAPAWHSLRHAWRGPDAFHRRYDALTAEDVPFAEDALGDQIVWRGGRVLLLSAETGDLEVIAESVAAFFEMLDRDAFETLSMHPLEQFRRDGGVLQPGELLNAYPPFCTAESAAGVSLRAVPALERHGVMAQLASTIDALPDGAQVEIRVDGANREK